MSAADLLPLDGPARAREAELAALEHVARGLGARFRIPGLERVDVEQIARIGIWEALEAWDGSSPRQAFARLVATRRVITALKTAQREKRRTDHEAVVIVRGASGELLEAVELLAEPVGLEERVAARAELRVIVDALAGLTELERQALATVARGETYARRRVGWDKRTDNAAQRARRKLRAALAHDAAA